MERGQSARPARPRADRLLGRATDAGRLPRGSEPVRLVGAAIFAGRDCRAPRTAEDVGASSAAGDLFKGACRAVSAVAWLPRGPAELP